jgi:hypothetical protein
MKRARMAALMTLIAAVASADVATAEEPPDGNTLQWSWSAQPVEGRTGEVDVVLKAGIQPGWILYSPDFVAAEFGPRPAQVVLEPADGNAVVGAPQAIGAARKTARNFVGEYSYTYFSGSAEIRQRVRVKDGAKTLNGRINGQTCFEASGLCTLFKESFSIAVP